MNCNVNTSYTVYLISNPQMGLENCYNRLRASFSQNFQALCLLAMNKVKNKEIYGAQSLNEDTVEEKWSTTELALRPFETVRISQDGLKPRDPFTHSHTTGIPYHTRFS